MRYNGIDPRTLHRAISIAKEIPPGIAGREVVTVRGNAAEYYAGTESQRSEYRVKVNIAARSPEEAWRVRALLARWAAGNGQPAPLEPGKWPGMAYDAAVKTISAPEFVRGFATVEITFVLPDGAAYEVRTSRANGTGGNVNMHVDGSETARPVISQKVNGASDGLTWSLDGAPLLRFNGRVNSGSTVEMDLQNSSLTIDGAHAEADADWTATDWQPDFLPGKHTISSSNGGEMQVRWHNRWQ